MLEAESNPGLEILAKFKETNVLSSGIETATPGL
jgi:hypothetical protein